MTVKAGKMDCNLFKSAFSGEVGFTVQTDSFLYEGVAPVHYAKFNGELSDNPNQGLLDVRVISNGGDKAKVATPDGVIISVPAGVVHY
jgi:hypothetical protein